MYPSGHCTFMWGKDTSPWMNDVLTMINDKPTHLIVEQWDNLIIFVLKDILII